MKHWLSDWLWLIAPVSLLLEGIGLTLWIGFSGNGWHWWLASLGLLGGFGMLLTFARVNNDSPL